MRRRVVLCLCLGLAAFLGVLAVNTLRHGSRQRQVAVLRAPAVDELAVARRLSGAVQLRTISWDTEASADAPGGETPGIDTSGVAPSAGAPRDRTEASRGALRALHAYLAQAFPKVHGALRREVIGDFSLLYTWPGTDPATQPILLMAHQDVVPIAPGTESRWHAPPFSGEIRDGFVWGRGAWDDKGNLMAILEAVESLVAAGFQPRRTIYLAFGHDEENGGTGARAVAQVLAQRGVHCEFALDEGSAITEGIMPGLAAPAAIIGIAEKGSLTLAVSADATPGHSSIPPTRSAIGVLARALTRIDAAPMPAAVHGVSADMLAALAPEMGGLQRIVLSNLWLFGGLVRSQLERSPATNALLRTTTALTVVRGGNKQNVLPGRAEAWINFRLLPGDTADRVIDHVRTAVADPTVRLEVIDSQAPSPVSSTTSPAYRLIEETVRALFPQVLVVPGLVIGATDSRHMAAVADDVYRFSPVRVRSEDLARFHGTDERIATANYVEVIQFYATLIRLGAGG